MPLCVPKSSISYVLHGAPCLIAPFSRCSRLTLLLLVTFLNQSDILLLVRCQSAEEIHSNH